MSQRICPRCGEPKSPRAKTCRRCSLERDWGGRENTQWRMAVLARDEHKCRRLGCDREGPTAHLEVHHVKNFRLHKEVRYQVSNGVTLCKDCHDEFYRRFGNFGNGWAQLNKFLEEGVQHDASAVL